MDDRMKLSTAVANPECARGGGVNHISAERRGVSFTFFLKMHENAIFSLIRGGGGRTPATPYAGSATEPSDNTITSLTLTWDNMYGSGYL